MKKFLPVLALIFVVIVGGVIFLLQKNNTPSPTQSPVEVEETAPELPFDQRPYVSLTPRSDGHWLKLTIAGVNKVPNAASVDYMLSYDVPDHPSQGVPGTVKLTGITTIDRDLLLGSESSGKFRYDEGVSKGQITLKFRNSSKKLIGMLSTEFHLLSKTEVLNSIDNQFSYKLSKKPTKGYFVVLNTFGLIEGVKGELVSGPYGVFSSETLSNPGVVTLEGASTQRYADGKWSTLKSGSSPDLGTFVSTK